LFVVVVAVVVATVVTIVELAFTSLLVDHGAKFRELLFIAQDPPFVIQR
jgi:hypothetical protein